MQYLDAISKMTEWSLLVSKANIQYHISRTFNITVPKLMPQRVMLKKLKLNGSMKTYKTFRTNTQKRGPFHYRGLECKSRSQETPGVTRKFGLGVWNEAGQRLIEFCQENALVIANTLFQQHKRRLYTWTWPDGQHRNQIDSILCSQRWRSSIQSAKTRPGADCGSDYDSSFPN